MKGRGNTIANNQQRGSALVMVLALVALVAAWAVGSAKEDWVSLRRSENMLLSSKAWLAVESGEALAMHVLAADDASVDAMDEEWALPAIPFPVDEGSIAIAIEDANRYLNLNDLVDAEGKAVIEAVDVFKRLFARLELDPLLVDALVDWLDRDSIPFGAGGVETGAYSVRPYGVKNAPLDTMNELLLVRGFDTESLKKLRACAIVRPSKGITPVNINTAGRDVLLSLGAGISPADVEALLRLRKTKSFSSVAELSNTAAGGWASSVPSHWLAVRSDAFVIFSEASFAHAHWAERLLVARQGGRLVVLARRKIPGWLQSTSS